MGPAKLFSLLVAALIFSLGGLAWWFQPLASFEGDLTRMGMLPERLFGWTAPQPPVQATWLAQASWQEAEVLVIGDSFSDERLWQTALTRRGLKVRTEAWSTLQGVCEDFRSWLDARGFRGHTLILESVERNVGSDIAKSLACRQTTYRPNRRVDAPRNPPHERFDTESGDHSGKMSVGIRARLHQQRYEQAADTPGFAGMDLPNDVRLARLPDGCRVFSHRACRDALFFGNDRREDVNDQVLTDMAALAPRFAGLKLLWLVIPNKSTAYLYPEKTFWQRAGQKWMAPDLLGLIQRSRQEGVKDFYPGNNTHFSTRGYLLVGEAVWQALKRPQGPGLRSSD